MEVEEERLILNPQFALCEASVKLHLLLHTHFHHNKLLYYHLMYCCLIL
jgi:hypothetical protein